MTRDEFLYGELKSGRALYLGLSIVYGLCTAAGVIMALFAYGKSGWQGVLACLGVAAVMGTSAANSWSQYRDYDNALKEVGDDPAGIDSCRTYSVETAQMIAVSRRPKGDYLQMWIAYGALMITLLGFGMLLLLLGIDDFSGDVLLTSLGALLLAGGALFLLLTVKAFRHWRQARYLESLEQ